MVMHNLTKEYWELIYLIEYLNEMKKSNMLIENMLGIDEILQELYEDPLAKNQMNWIR